MSRNRALQMMLTILVGLVGVACADFTAEEVTTGQDQLAVYGGEMTDEFDAVGMVHPVGCTGTLVHPQVFVTAAHCCRDGRCSDSVEVGGVSVGIANVVVSPDYHGTAEAPDGSADLAAVILSERVSHVDPLGIAASDPYVGRELTLVGYGCNTALDNTTGYGTKRIGQNSIDAVGTHVDGFKASRYERSFGVRTSGTSADAGLCPGDSGGPALWTENGALVVAGIAALGSPSTGTSYWTSVSSHNQWLRAVVASETGEDMAGDYPEPGAAAGGCQAGQTPQWPGAIFAAVFALLVVQRRRCR